MTPDFNKSFKPDHNLKSNLLTFDKFEFHVPLLSLGKRERSN